MTSCFQTSRAAHSSDVLPTQILRNYSRCFIALNDCKSTATTASNRIYFLLLIHICIDGVTAPKSIDPATTWHGGRASLSKWADFMAATNRLLEEGNAVYFARARLEEDCKTIEQKYASFANYRKLYQYVNILCKERTRL